MLSDRIKAFNALLGRLVAWLTVPMVLGTFAIVVLRYAFDLGWIWMQESIGWMHAAVFMLAAAYTLGKNEHVRVDVFYAQMSARRRALVDACGIVFFLLPIAVFLIVSSWDYVAVSWQIGERSREAGGLPYPWIPLLKSLIPLTAATLALQGVAELIDNVLVLAGRAAASSPPPVDAAEGL
jgi:TRAP-type mannitol/chloroaromatic compound transport system permease small subunit